MRGSLPGKGARKGGKGGGEAAGPPAKRAAAGGDARRRGGRRDGKRPRRTVELEYEKEDEAMRQAQASMQEF